MNTIVPIKDPNDVLEAIYKILEKRKDIYINAPQKPNIKVEVIIDRCKSEYCPKLPFCYIVKKNETLYKVIRI